MHPEYHILAKALKDLKDLQIIVENKIMEVYELNDSYNSIRNKEEEYPKELSEAFILCRTYNEYAYQLMTDSSNL